MGNRQASEKEHLVTGTVERTGEDGTGLGKVKEGAIYRWKILAFFMGLFYIGCIVLSTVCVQLLERTIPDFELNFIRCLFGLIVFSGYFVLRRHSPLVPKSGILTTVAYGTVVAVISLCSYISVTFIPLTSLQSVKITINISLSMILFAICLKESITVKSIVSALLSITGVILIIQPGFIFTRSQSGSFEQSKCHY